MLVVYRIEDIVVHYIAPPESFRKCPNGKVHQSLSGYCSRRLVLRAKERTKVKQLKSSKKTKRGEVKPLLTNRAVS